MSSTFTSVACTHSEGVITHTQGGVDTHTHMQGGAPGGYTHTHTHMQGGAPGGYTHTHTHREGPLVDTHTHMQGGAPGGYTHTGRGDYYITFLFLAVRAAAVISWIEYLSDVSIPILVRMATASSDISTSSSSHLHYRVR